MHVTESIEFVLKPNSPYDFARTVGHVTGNAGEYALDKFVDGTYTRVLSINDQYVLLSAQSSEGFKQTELVCNLSALDGRPHDAEEFQNIISWMFSVDEDLSEFYGMASKDPLMHDLIKDFHGLQILRSPSLFESIVRFSNPSILTSAMSLMNPAPPPPTVYNCCSTLFTNNL